MSDQEQRDGGFFVVRGGLAIDVTDQVEEAMSRAARRRAWTLVLGLVADAEVAREDAGTALSPNRGPTSRPVDIRMPAVAREGDEIDM